MQLNKNCKPPVVCSYMQVPVLKTTQDEQLVNYFFNWKHPFPANEQSVTLLSPWREFFSCIPLPHYSFGRERRTMALQDMPGPFQRPLFTPCHIRILRGEGNAAVQDVHLNMLLLHHCLHWLIMVGCLSPPLNILSPPPPSPICTHANPYTGSVWTANARMLLKRLRSGNFLAFWLSSWTGEFWPHSEVI